MCSVFPFPGFNNVLVLLNSSMQNICVGIYIISESAGKICACVFGCCNEVDVICLLKISPPSDGNSANAALQCIRLGLLDEKFRLGDKVQL